MNATIRNFFVGIFVLGAICLLVGVILFLKPSVGDGKQILYVRFSDINNINVGTRVLFAGKPVGEVEAIEAVQGARKEATDELGRVYFYQLTLRVDSKVRVFNTDEITIQTSGLLGEKSIAIVPKAPPQGVTPTQITTQPIYADSVDSLSNALIEFSELASSMEEAFKEFRAWIQENGTDVANMIRSTGKAMDQIEVTIATINDDKLIEDIQRSVRSFTSTICQVQSAMEAMEQKNTFKNFGTVMENLKGASHNVELVTEDLADGRGTLGRLITDDDLYLKANAVMNQANTLMSDINHYGLLFHLNKQWQRTRLQRMNELNALNSPKNFRAYFQQEVNDINSSMNRISLLIERAEECAQKEEVFQSCDFKCDFYELMQKADELSETLRLYNQQLQEAN